jgi:hypothetical protein
MAADLSAFLAVGRSHTDHVFNDGPGVVALSALAVMPDG